MASGKVSDGEDASETPAPAGMSGYTLHPEAFRDIDDIRAYIAEDDPDAADRIVTEIFDTIRGRVWSPHQGYRRPNLSSRALRFALVRVYAIAYAPDLRPLLFTHPPLDLAQKLLFPLNLHPNAQPIHGQGTEQIAGRFA